MLCFYLWKASIWCHRHGFRLGARFFKTLTFFGWGALLEPEAELEGHVNFSHRGLGVTVHGTTTIGDWAQIYQHVMIGSNNDKDAPVRHGVRIGRGVVLGAYAIVMCPMGRSITIGDRAVIGAGAIVTDDVPPGGLVLPEPSKIVGIRKDMRDQDGTAPTAPATAAPPRGDLQS
jgi:serine acetyltransferase